MSRIYQDENERLVAEQAVLVYRSVVEAMRNAPHGQGLACMEAAVLEQGRGHLRQILERAATAHPEAQKKRVAVMPVPVVDPAPSATVHPRR
jgi:hypothetical protein